MIVGRWESAGSCTRPSRQCYNHLSDGSSDIGRAVALTTNDSSFRNWASSTAIGVTRSEISPGGPEEHAKGITMTFARLLQWLARALGPADLEPRCHANDVVGNHRRRRTTTQLRYC